MKYLKLPEAEVLNRLFDYNPHTGDLTRKTTIVTHAKKGDVIKQKDAKGYLKVRVGGTRFSVHRIIYKMYYGDEDRGRQIDHINGVRDDNRILNLRLVDQSTNQKNSYLRSDNKSGHVGVFQTPFNTWVSYIQSSKKYQCLGTFKTKEGAIKARKSAEKMLSFSERHGRKKRNTNSNRDSRTPNQARTPLLAQQQSAHV
jgi:hypothetical protein